MSDTTPHSPPPQFTDDDLKETAHLLKDTDAMVRAWWDCEYFVIPPQVRAVASVLRARERKGHAEGYALGYHDGKGPKPIHPELEQSCRDTAQRDEYEEGLRERGDER